MEVAVLCVNFFKLRPKVYKLTSPSDLNLPLTAIAFVLVSVFLSVRQPEGSIRSKLAQVDWM